MNEKPVEQTPVDRARRFYFVSRFITFCLLSSLCLILLIGINLIAPPLSLVELYVSSVLGTTTAIGLAYITGSVVDYNGGFGNMFKGREDEEPKG